MVLVSLDTVDNVSAAEGKTDSDEKKEQSDANSEYFHE